MRGRLCASAGKRRTANATWFLPRFSTDKSLEGWVGSNWPKKCLFVEEFWEGSYCDDDAVGGKAAWWNLWSAYIFLTNKKEDDPNFHFLKDFEDFDIANEDDVLEEFLGLERLKPKVCKSHTFNWPNFCIFIWTIRVFLYLYIWINHLKIDHFPVMCLIWWFQIEPFKTGAVAPEVNKLKVGKLDLKEEEKSSAKKEVTPWAVYLFDCICFIVYLYLRERRNR